MVVKKSDFWRETSIKVIFPVTQLLGEVFLPVGNGKEAYVLNRTSFLRPEINLQK